MDMTEIKALIEDQGKAFDAFKETHEELKKNDTLTAEKLERIEKSLDAAVEAKNKLEVGFAAERKEREDLEARLNKARISGGSDEAKAHHLAVAEFNHLLKSAAAERGKVVQPLDASGYDAYKSAWGRWFREGKDALSADEVKTLSVGSDPDGGYFVTPDVSGRIAKKVYETSPMRQIASIQAITTDALEGIEDTGEAGAGYAGEHGTSGDTTTPQVGKWRIPVFWIDTEPKATQQLLDDAAVDIEAWLAGKVSDKFGRFETSEFINGNVNKIQGLAKGVTTASDDGTGVTWGSVGYIPAGASGDFTGTTPMDKIHDIVGALKAYYLTNARWLTRRQVITKIRKFKDGQNNYIWQPSLIAGQPETIMGYPVARAEDMPALAANSYSLAFGDFAEAYQIVDRMGIRVLRDPYTSKPYVKFYTTKRVGGGVVNYEAYKLMKFASS